MELGFHALDTVGVDVLTDAQKLGATVPEQPLVKGSAPKPVAVVVEFLVSGADQ